MNRANTDRELSGNEILIRTPAHFIVDIKHFEINWDCDNMEDYYFLYWLELSVIVFSALQIIVDPSSIKRSSNIVLNYIKGMMTKLLIMTHNFG